MQRGGPKPLHWIGSSYHDLLGFPDEVQDHVGYARYQAQIGMKHWDAKPMLGLGSGILEIVSALGRNAYRAVYLVGFAEAVYVLPAFQKKSKHGIATPRHEIDTIGRRLKMAERDHEQFQME